MKIKRIHISNYRAFLVNGDKEAKRYTIDLPNGENLLIYGENGSGKSSLFSALRDFFISALSTGQMFQKNLFYEPENNTDEPFIDIEFDDNSHHRFSADGNQYILVDGGTQSNTNYIAQSTITNGFISYRDLLKLHFRHINHEPDLFSLFLGEEGLFSSMTVPAPAKAGNKISFKDLWKKCLQADQDAIDDFNTNIILLFKDLESKANMLLAYFQQECKLTIEFEGARTLDPDSKLNPVFLPSISFNVTLFEREIPSHIDFLNEARLTALAISVFLAHQLCRPATELRILFLDDIFIGLDMSNRIPMIKILNTDNLGDGTSFKDFQIFINTYDREWFNIAKGYLDKDWQKIELYIDSHSHRIERPLIRRSESYRESAEYYLSKGDYPASANYLRKAFEQEFGRILPENTLYPGFNSTSGDNSIIAVSKRKLTISENAEAWFYKVKQTEDAEIQSFKFISLQQMIDQFKVLINQYNIPFKLIEELISLKNRLLNPLSHDDLRSSIFKAELITGFEILDEIQKIVSKVILSISNSNPIQLYCIKKDHKSDVYYYRFELMENLRFIQYGGFRIFLNSKIRSQYRAKQFKNFEVMEQDYQSLKRLCNGIFFLSDPQGQTSSFYDNFMFDEVFTLENKSLSELL